MDLLDELDLRLRVYRRLGMERSLESHMAASVLLGRLQALRVRRINAVVREWNLTTSTFEALSNLSSFPDGKCSLSTLSDLMILHQTTITSTVDRLERLGYATRVPHPTDRRTTFVVLQDNGRDVLALANEGIAAIRFGFGSLTNEDAEQLLEALKVALRGEST